MFLRNRKKFSKGLTQDRLSAVHMKKVSVEELLFVKKENRKTKLMYFMFHKNLTENQCQRGLWSKESTFEFWFKMSQVCTEEVRRAHHSRRSVTGWSCVSGSSLGNPENWWKAPDWQKLYFQHDGDPIHTANIKAYLDRRRQKETLSWVGLPRAQT